MIKLNIQWKTTLIFLSVIISLVSIFNLLLLPQIEQSIEEKSFENIQNVVRFYGSDIEHYLSINSNTIEILARNPVFEKENVTEQEILEQLNTTKYYYTDYEDISYLDTNGNVIVSTNYQYRGDWKANKWYLKTLEGNRTVSDAYIILRPWKLVLQFFSPVINETGTVIGAIAGQMNFNEFWDLLNSVHVGKTGHFVLINKQGNILSYQNQSMIFHQFDLFEQGRIDEDKTFYVGMSHLQENTTSIFSYMKVGADYLTDSYWTLVFLQDYSEIHESITSFRITAFSIFSVVILIIILIGFYISRSLIKPVNMLKDGMNTISKGNLDYRIDIKQKDEFAVLADSFNTMASDLQKTKKTTDIQQEKIEALLAQKDEFINQLGHDLKNPLGPLLNLIPIISKKQKDPQTREMLDVVLRNVHYMKNLVTKTIQLAHLKSPNVSLHFEDVNLKQEISDIVQTNKILFSHNDISVYNHVPSHMTISVDRIRFQQLINNLLSNSVKYSLNAGSITISSKLEEDHIMVSLKDQGIGMNKKQLSHIFDEFYKADESRHDFESSGLGMSICKQIVEKHGGKIWVDSEGENKGTTFYFTLPISHSDHSYYIENEDIHSDIDRLLGL